jgi:Flp pilus assembly protein TadG
MRCNLFSAAGLKRFGADTKAVSGVEFALLLPVIILLLLGSFDITRAISAKTKTVLLSRTLADFVAQNQTITTAQLAGIVKTSAFILDPFPSDAAHLTVNIESVNKQANNTFQIDWSYPPANSSNRSTTSTSTDTSSIRASVRYTYKLKFAGKALANFGVTQIVLQSTTTMLPRWGTAITANGW